MFAMLAYPDADYLDAYADWKYVDVDFILISWLEVNICVINKNLKRKEKQHA